MNPISDTQSIASLDEYRRLTDALVQRCRTDQGVLALALEIDPIIRFEIEHQLPDELRLGARLATRPGRTSGRTAIISDIHGSLDGLQVALDDIARQRCDRILCLGDLVDGGPKNDQVVETLRCLAVPCVRGNHDEYHDAKITDESRQFLSKLPERIIDDDVLYVHISPRSKKRKIDHAVEAWNVFDENSYRLIFIGHVHVPMVFGKRCDTFGEAKRHAFEYNKPLKLSSADQYIVCVGAIAYGRDNIGKIRYAIHDHEQNSVELRAIDGPLLPMDYTLGGTTIEFS